MITRDQAYKKLNELIDNENLIKHCLAVEAAMLQYAEYFDIPEEDRKKWAVSGLIHDADWEKYPQEHPNVILEWLDAEEADEDVINAVASHGYHFGEEAKTRMAKTLRAVDELTGLIVAVALVRPNKTLEEVNVESVMKKWDSSNFASGVSREDIERGATEIEVPLQEHVEIVLNAMKGISDELGL